MAYNGYITTLKNVRPHPNADRLQLGECFGNTVCVNLDYKNEQIGVYFPTDGQLSVEFCEYNNLVRKKDENGNNIGGYMDPDKRNVTSIRLRGEKSDGLFLPLTCLEFTEIDLSTLNVGDIINVVNGHEICKKYIPRRNHRQGGYSNGNRTRKHKEPIAPLFVEHADTEQLAYNLAAFKPGDEIEITLKMHGTSQRTGYLPVFKGYNDSFWCNVKNTFRHILNKMEMYCGNKKIESEIQHDGEPIYDWDYISGTRRVVLDSYDGGFYGSNEFREQHSKIFEGKLWKGETVYYEVVGFTHTGAPIMSTADNKKLNDKEFIKQYGKETVFSYGCEPYGICASAKADPNYNTPVSDIYIYRMTMTNEDGHVVEYTPDFMRYRCEQMGIKTVPVMWKGVIPEYKPHQLWTTEEINDDIPGFRPKIDAGEYVKWLAEQYYDGPDPIGKTHIREGVVVRILNRPKFCAYKHKNFNFKVLEGIVKADAIAPDMEEAQEEENNGI